MAGINGYDHEDGYPGCWRRTTGVSVVAFEIGYLRTVAHLSMELIERFAMRELSKIEIQRVEKHVASCPRCEERLQEQVDSWAAMRSSTVAMVRKIARADRKRTAQP